MTLLFSSSIKQLTIGKILEVGLQNGIGVTVYQGAQPTAAEIIASWTTYNSSTTNYLGTYFGVGWSHPLNGDATFTSITSFPAAILPTRAGTGAWCIIWAINPTSEQLSSTTLPSALFIVTPVSDLNGRGAVRFSVNTEFVLGQSKAIVDGVIGAALV